MSYTCFYLRHLWSKQQRLLPYFTYQTVNYYTEDSSSERKHQKILLLLPLLLLKKVVTWVGTGFFG